MQQPKPMTAIEDLREFLRFAVPLRAAALLAEYPPHELESVLPALAQRWYGNAGDTLQYRSDVPEVRRTAIQTASDLTTGVAAAALLAGPDGITVFGDHYGPSGSGKPQPSPKMPQQKTTLADLSRYEEAA
ncbi:hypothetical protein [Streptomyces sp. XH2]|uniref:hypothetical protein n=1 Tax=Streptomyces sp. XH2 TaxID=3412483 RepID=UPI003C7D3CA9